MVNRLGGVLRGYCEGIGCSEEKNLWCDGVRTVVRGDERGKKAALRVLIKPPRGLKMAARMVFMKPPKELKWAARSGSL